MKVSCVRHNISFPMLSSDRAVSMLDGHLFNTLAALADRLRKKTNRPFGGLQVRVCVLVDASSLLIARGYRRLFPTTTCVQGRGILRF